VYFVQQLTGVSPDGIVDTGSDDTQLSLLVVVVTVGENLITIKCVCLGGKRAPHVCKNMILH